MKPLGPGRMPKICLETAFDGTRWHVCTLRRAHTGWHQSWSMSGSLLYTWAIYVPTKEMKIWRGEV